MSSAIQAASTWPGRAVEWVRAWLASSVAALGGESRTRLVLLGLVVTLQNCLELPRDAVAHAIGPTVTAALVCAILIVFLVLLLAALWPRVPLWRWLEWRWVQVAVLLAVLGGCVTGLHQVAVIATTPLHPPTYSNDGTTLDHYAAIQLEQGHNPYVTSSIVAAVDTLGQDPARTTPLHQGAFASQPLIHLPSDAQLRAVFSREPVGPASSIREFESHVSYPALAFLPLVPLVWAGLPSVVPFFGLCLLALAIILMTAVPTGLRLWVGLLLLGSAPLLDATQTGDLDVFYVVLVVIAWRWWRRPVLSAVALGLACAAKQIAWFFLPFYVLLVWRRRGWREALLRASGSVALCAVINLPFIVNAPRAWVASILAPQVDPMFPEGSGLIRLSLGGLLPLAPSTVYTALEGLAVIVALAVYWKYGRRFLQGEVALGLVLAVIPLFFAWRSLTTYFYFVAVPTVVLLLAEQWRSQRVVMAAGTVSGSVLDRDAADHNGLVAGVTGKCDRLDGLQELPERLRGL